MKPIIRGIGILPQTEGATTQCAKEWGCEKEWWNTVPHTCSDSHSLLRSLLHYSATALTPEHLLSIATPILTITYSIYSVLTDYYK